MYVTAMHATDVMNPVPPPALRRHPAQFPQNGLVCAPVRLRPRAPVCLDVEADNALAAIDGTQMSLGPSKGCVRFCDLEHLPLHLITVLVSESRNLSRTSLSNLAVCGQFFERAIRTSAVREADTGRCTSTLCLSLGCVCGRSKAVDRPQLCKKKC